MELIPIPPRRHLRPLRIAHPHERRPFFQPRKADVVRRHPQPRVAKQPLAFFNGLPSLLERREIPSLARAAHHPQPALRGVEREATANRKVLDGLVAAEAGMTEDAGGVHADRIGRCYFCTERSPLSRLNIAVTPDGRNISSEIAAISSASRQRSSSS